MHGCYHWMIVYSWSHEISIRVVWRTFWALYIFVIPEKMKIKQWTKSSAVISGCIHSKKNILAHENIVRNTVTNVSRHQQHEWVKNLLVMYLTQYHLRKCNVNINKHINNILTCNRMNSVRRIWIHLCMEWRAMGFVLHD